MKRVKIADIIPPILHKDVMSKALFESHFHILLYAAHDQRAMLIGIDKYEARPMAMTLTKKPHDRREIYQLVQSILHETSWNLEGVYITGSVDGGPIETKIRLRQRLETIDLPCRPSDGFTLALQMQSPIYILNEMLDKFSFVVPEKYLLAGFRERGIKELTQKIHAVMQTYEKEFAQMSHKAAHKSMDAYAKSSTEVLDYVFGRR